MLTQCPNPTCRKTFEAPDERSGKNGPCPQCGQVITFRSLDILKKIERERQWRERAGTSSGGTHGARLNPTGLMALIEDVRSLWNVGAIFRTADGAGCTHLFLCGITGCPPRKEIAKTSLGAEDSVPWSYHSGALEIIPSLKEKGVRIVALEQTPTSRPLGEALEQIDLQRPACLVLGNEVAGVSAEALTHCDCVCHLPMRGVKNSLNVAIAFGIACYMFAEKLPNVAPTADRGPARDETPAQGI